MRESWDLSNAGIIWWVLVFAREQCLIRWIEVLNGTFVFAQCGVRPTPGSCLAWWRPELAWKQVRFWELFGLKGNFGFLRLPTPRPFTNNEILVVLVGWSVVCAEICSPGARKQAVGENCLGIRQETIQQVVVQLLCCD